MPQAISGGTGVTLSDGRVLVVGGYEPDNGFPALPIPAAELYDPSTGYWSQAAAPSGLIPIYPNVLALPGDRALVVSVIGGTASAGIYDARTNSWAGAASPSFTVYSNVAGADLPDGDALLAVDSQASLYDPATGSSQWTASPGMDSQYGTTDMFAAELSDGRVFLAGDYGADTAVSPQIYDATTDTWSFAPPSGELAAAAPLTDDHLLVLAGSQAGPATGTEFFDAADNGWSPAPALPEARQEPAMASLPDGRVLVAGGFGSDGQLTSGDLFTPPTTYPQDAADDDVQIDGTPAVGDTLSATGGTGAFQYQWQRCAPTCVDVGSPSAPTASPSLYTIAPADAGARLRVVATDNLLDSHTSSQTAAVSWPVVSLPSATVTESSTAHSPSILVRRTVDSEPATVRYQLTAPAPGPDALYPPYTGILEFPPGKASEAIPLALTDHGAPILARDIAIRLLAPSGAYLGTPSSGEVFICVPDQGCGDGTARNFRNPLELAATPPASDPLPGGDLFVDRTGTAAARAATRLSRAHRSEARVLDEIVDQPDVTRFGTWNGNYPGAAVQSFLERVQQQEPGTIPMLATYKLVDSHVTHPECGRWADPPTTQAEYHEWVTNLAEGIGAQPAVLFLEMDSMITVGCLSKQGLAIRLAELRDAINILQDDPHLLVYLDAGAADAVPAARMARLLEQAGIAKIQGFFLNSTHFDWTSKEIKYGEEISKLTGGKHFVINTAENGQGPLVPTDRAKNGNEVLCNPPGRGLGPRPTTNTGYRNLDAFAWIANPGVSGGVCGPGQPPGGEFSIPLALSLVKHADFKIR
jgi:endoglucanase